MMKNNIRNKLNAVELHRLIILVCVILLAIAGIPINTYADTEKEVVRVGYYENEIFQEGAEEGEVKSGYAYEYYRKLSEYTGWEYEYVYGDFGDLYQMLLDGEIDMLAGLAWKEDRAGVIGYPDEEMGNESYYLVKNDNNVDITANPSTLNGCRIGVLDSAMLDVLNRYLDEHNVDADVVTYSDYKDLFNAFDSRDVDVLAAESDGAYGRDHSEVLTVFGTSDYYLCVNIDRSDLLAELNSAQALLAAEEPNYLNSLRAKYYSVSVTAMAFSQSEREWMEEHTALHVGYLENYLPYSGTDDKGEVTGIVKDIIPDILDTVGMQDIEVTYSGYASYDDMIAAVRSGDMDVAFPVGGGLYYSEENGIYQSNPVSASDAEIVYKGDFNEKTTEHFAINENNRMQYYFVQTNYPEAEITFYPSSDECLKAVLEGKAGCATLNGLRANDILRNRKYKELSRYQTSYSDTRCFGVEIGNEGLLKLLNRGVNVLGDDYYQSISYKYTSGLYSYSFLDLVLDNMALVGTIILLISIIVVFLLARDIRRTRKEVEEKEKARRDLSDALLAAERANRAKTAFLNNMSHDIRTPMNAIVGFTRLADENIDNKEKVQDYLGKISVSSQHLLSLINDVLDMSRIESGKVTLEETDVHLPDMIQELKTIIQSNIASKQLELSIDMQDVKHEDIIMDKLRLNQVLLNILSNAIKFTPEGGIISFSVIEKTSSADDTADFEFRIKDNGIGMSEEFQKTIFETFTREKTSTVSGIQGTGLGMAIAKNIVDMMGGTISVISKEGEGSEFVVELPCKISSSSTKARSQSEMPDLHSAVNDDEPEADLAQPLSASKDEQIEKDSEAGSMPDFSGKRVLLVEDNQLNQILAENILTSVGLDVDIASDGTEAVEKMKSASQDYYDIILMDIQMPQMDGYEATRQIRALDDKIKSAIPIVAVTANAFEEDRKISMEVGMNGHLAKPYDIPEIMKTLSELLN
ncbi:Signal transduction histidine kinase [Lachnospiraceae bacterium NE2001]|nr:Signal transduction histidine kinase [Lachnospiraceae bacterium NE2001]